LLLALAIQREMATFSESPMFHKIHLLTYASSSKELCLLACLHMPAGQLVGWLVGGQPYGERKNGNQTNPETRKFTTVTRQLA